MVAPSPRTIISKDQFEQYAAAWLGLVSQPDAAKLAQAFVGEYVPRLPYVSFPLASIIGLLSAVGVHQIKARFIAVPGKTAGDPRFSLVLFACNAKGDRLTAYYLAQQPRTAYAASARPVRAATVALAGEQVPQGLANIWLDNWNDKKLVIAPAMFGQVAGPLQGYNFGVNEFLTPLYKLQPFKNPDRGTKDKTTSKGEEEIRLHFGLHEFFGPDSDGTALTQTFGLVVRSSRTKSAGGEVEEVEEGSFDMAMPCPPGP